MASSDGGKQAANSSHGGDGPEIQNNLGSSLHSEDRFRMSSDEFERESDGNQSNLLHSSAEKGEKITPILATP